MDSHPSSRLSVTLILSAWICGPAYATENTTPMLWSSEIARSMGTGTQGVTGSAAGSLHYPDQIMAYPVRQTDENKELIVAWSTTHKFFIVPVSVGVEPGEGMVPEDLALTLTFSGLGEMSKQPIIIDCFPQTGFVPSSLQASAHLKLDGSLKFVIAPAASTGADAGLEVDAKYSPHYASVVSGFGSASAFWQFKKTQSSYPAGELPLKLIIAVPNRSTGQSINMAADIRVNYSGSWWKKGTTIGSFRSQITLPQ